MNVSGRRYCRHCGRTYPLEHFHFRRGRPTHICIACKEIIYLVRAPYLSYRMMGQKRPGLRHKWTNEKPPAGVPCAFCGTPYNVRYYWDADSVLCGGCRERLADACKSFKGCRA